MNGAVPENQMWRLLAGVEQAARGAQNVAVSQLIRYGKQEGAYQRIVECYSELTSCLLHISDEFQADDDECGKGWCLEEGMCEPCSHVDDGD